MSGAMPNSNIFGMTGMTFNMAANDFDPYKTYSLPDTWTTDASKASSVSNPYSSLSYSNPGSYQSYTDWSSWKPADQTYRSQYNDNGYSLDTAKSFYQQPSGGDWASYQTALQTPGEVAAKQAYDLGTKQLSEWAGANGLYGSSVMANQATQNVLQPYLDALTTNAASAAAQRYQTQDASNQYLANLANSIYGTRTSEWGNIDARNLQEALAQNQYNQTQDQQKLSQQLALNQYNLSNANAQNAFNMNQAQGNAQWNQWANTYDNGLLQQGWSNAADQAKFDAAQHQQAYQNYYNFWNNINPGQEEYLQNQTANAAKSREGNSGGLMSGIGSIAGTLLGGSTGGLGGLLTSGTGYLLGSGGSNVGWGDIGRRITSGAWG